MYTGKSFFSGFIHTMQFVEQQHNLKLKALILSKFKRGIIPRKKHWIRISCELRIYISYTS